MTHRVRVLGNGINVDELSPGFRSGGILFNVSGMMELEVER